MYVAVSSSSSSLPPLVLQIGDSLSARGSEATRVNATFSSPESEKTGNGKKRHCQDLFLFYLLDFFIIPSPFVGLDMGPSQIATINVTVQQYCRLTHLVRWFGFGTRLLFLWMKRFTQTLFFFVRTSLCVLLPGQKALIVAVSCECAFVAQRWLLITSFADWLRFELLGMFRETMMFVHRFV